MPSAVLIQKRKEFEAKQDKVAKIFKEAGAEVDKEKVTSLTGDSKAKVAELRKMNDELNDLKAEIQTLVDVEEMAKASTEREREIEGAKPKGFMHPEGEARTKLKSAGEIVTSDEKFKGYSKSGGKIKIELPNEIEMKTLMTTAAGFAPESLRTGEVVPYVRRPPNVFDLIPKGQTGNAAVIYMEQTTRTSPAVEITEGSTAAAGEAQLVWTERSQTVEEVVVWIPVTSQQLEDVPQMQGIIQDELGQMLRERLDYQIINGSGSTPYLQGILNKTGIQSLAASGNRFDVLFNGAKLIRVTGRSNPNAMIMHPNDWGRIRLMRTEDGLYILGSPSQPGPDVIWGMMVVENTAISETSVVCGDFSPAWIKLMEKRGIVIEITDSHDTYFIYGKYAIKATVRVAVVIKRPAAFCEITGF